MNFVQQFRTELEFIVSIDFTRSNLPLDHAASLHHENGTNTSQYEIAIQAIAEICQHYNNSQTFYAFGFGARLPNDNRVNFHFPLVRSHCLRQLVYG